MNKGVLVCLMLAVYGFACASSLMGYAAYESLGAFNAFALKELSCEQRFESTTRSNIFALTSSADLQKLRDFHKTKTIIIKAFLPEHCINNSSEHLRWQKYADTYQSSLIFASVDHQAYPFITGLTLNTQKPFVILSIRGDNIKHHPSLDEHIIKSLIP